MQVFELYPTLEKVRSLQKSEDLVAKSVMSKNTRVWNYLNWGRDWSTWKVRSHLPKGCHQKKKTRFLHNLILNQKRQGHLKKWEGKVWVTPWSLTEARSIAIQIVSSEILVIERLFHFLAKKDCHQSFTVSDHLFCRNRDTNNMSPVLQFTFQRAHSSVSAVCKNSSIVLDFKLFCVFLQNTFFWY